MSLADLHEPLDAIFAELARWARWPAGARLLDAGCGSGLKTELLFEALSRSGTIVGIDWDVQTLQVIQKVQTDLTLHASRFTLAGDLSALPFAKASFDGIWCSAVLGLLADPTSALREMRRVLRPNGITVVATGAQCWSALHRWPPDVAAKLAAAYQRALAAGFATPYSELCDDLAAQLNAASFANIATRAFLIETPALAPQPAELALIPWAALRHALAPLLDTATLAAAEQHAAEPEDVELVSVLLAARGEAL